VNFVCDADGGDKKTALAPFATCDPCTRLTFVTNPDRGGTLYSLQRHALCAHTALFCKSVAIGARSIRLHSESAPGLPTPLANTDDGHLSFHMNVRNDCAQFCCESSLKRFRHIVLFPIRSRAWSFISLRRSGPDKRTCAKDIITESCDACICPRMHGMCRRHAESGHLAP
jgi:hypothetical protein